MAYGILKVDTITFTDGGVDKSVPVSGLVLNPTFTGNVTVTGTISGNIIQGGTTVSGLTVTGTTANFASGVFTTRVSGLLITGPTVSATTGTFTSLTGTTTNGTTASFTTGNFTSLTGTTTTGTTVNFASGVFTTRVSGLLITGPTVSATTGTFTSLTGTTTTGTTANFASGVFTTRVSGLLITGPTVSATTGTFTSLTGTTTTGTTANFASGVFTTQISGVTITGTTVSATTGNFTSLTGTTATITSGIIASGTAALPSLAILSDPNTGIYSPGADQLAVATNGVARLSVAANGDVTFNHSIDLPNVNTYIKGGGHNVIQVDATRTYFYGGTSGVQFRTADNVSDLVNITNAGLVGIGNTTGLNGRLGVSGNISLSGNGTSARYLALLGEVSTYAGSYVLQAGGGSAGFGGAITMYGHSHATYPGSVYIGTSTGSGGKLYFGTGNALDPATATRMTVDDNGRVLVGTSTDTNNARLQEKLALVTIGSGNIGGMAITNYGGTGAGSRPLLDFQRSRGTTDGSFTAVASGDQLGSIIFRGADGSQFADAAFINCEVDGTPGASDMPGRLVFSTTADGASSPTERLRITSTGQVRLAGAGITFNGDTAAANELDDYEEGTWTPSANSGITGSSGLVGKYTKIGRIVYAYGASDATGITGAIVIGGLPFANGNSRASTVTAILSNVTSNAVENSFVDTSATTFNIKVNGTYSGAAISMYFACWYFV